MYVNVAVRTSGAADDREERSQAEAGEEETASDRCHSERHGSGDFR